MAFTTERKSVVLGRPPGRAFGKTGELRPDDAGINRGLANPGTVAAIASGDDVFAPHEPGIAADALRDQLRVLNKVGLRLDHARDQHFALGQFHILENRPFMRMAWVGGLEREAARLGEKDGLDDVSERHVAMVRTFVISPAEVQAQPVRRDVLQRVIERFDVEPCLFAEFAEAQLGVLDVPPHREIWAVDLQDQTGLGNGLVFLPHSLGDRE